MAGNAARWRNLPGVFGKWSGVHARFRRWSHAGVWERLFYAFADTPDFEYVLSDSTISKVHADATDANVWAAPSASGLCLMFRAVCENVSGLSTRGHWPRWRSARPGPPKGPAFKCHFYAVGFQHIGRLSGPLLLTFHRHHPAGARCIGRSRSRRSCGHLVGALMTQQCLDDARHLGRQRHHDRIGMRARQQAA